MPAGQTPSNFVVIAKIIREWGIKGSLRILPLAPGLSCLKPQETVWFLNLSGVRERKKIISLKTHGKYLIISLDGICDVESARSWRNSVIETERGDLPQLEQGEYYHDQIIGLSVVTAEGRSLGVVTEIFSTGSNDVYVVRDTRKEFLIPAIRDVINHIDLTGKKIIINNIEGLID